MRNDYRIVKNTLWAVLVLYFLAQLFLILEQMVQAGMVSCFSCFFKAYSEQVLRFEIISVIPLFFLSIALVSFCGLRYRQRQKRKEFLTQVLFLVFTIAIPFIIMLVA